MSVKQWLTPIIDTPVVDFWLERLGINYRWQQATARIIHIEKQGDTLLLSLKPSRLFIGFKPGQHIGVSIEIAGVLHQRCYSIANTPDISGLIQLAIKCQGVVSEYLYNSAKTGQVIEISQAWGVEHEQSYDIYIAGGIGITAILPLVQHALVNQHPARGCKLFYLKNSAAPMLFSKQLDQLVSQHGLELICCDGRQALSDANFFDNAIASNSKVMACGSSGFIEQLNQRLQSKVSLLDVQSFGGDSQQTDSPETDNKQAKQEKRPVTISLLKSGIELVSDNQANLLQTLIDAGVPVLSGCRQGICHQCSCQLASGSVVQSNSTIEQLDDSHSSPIQPCISTASSDIALNL